MTLPNFQSFLAELVANSAAGIWDASDLTEVEKRRLDRIASEAGLEVMRTLYFSWRLTKVLSLLPFTATLLGDELLAHHLRVFWRENKATSLYFIDECLAFLAFLERNIDNTPPFLEDVVAFERAKLYLRDDLSAGRVPRRQFVRFRYAPAVLFNALSTGSNLSEVPTCKVLLKGELTEEEGERWTVVEVKY